MEYSKDEIFVVRYNEKEDKLKFTKKNTFFRKIINNKFLTLLIILGAIFSSVNFILIYKFTELLKII